MHPNEKAAQDLEIPSIKIEDLPVEDSKDADVKGGPIYMHYPPPYLGGRVAPDRP